jgi:hypothetical protein
MINFEKYYNANDNGDFAVINEEGSYHARLMMVRISKQDKYIEEGKEPRDQISFLFDVLNEKGLSCHVATRPTSITFTDRSNLPKILNKLGQPTCGKELQELLYTKDGELKDIYCKVYVDVQEKENGIFNNVTKIISVEEPTDQPVSKIVDWDLKVFGKDIEAGDVNPAYKAASNTDEEDDFIEKVKKENNV